MTYLLLLLDHCVLLLDHCVLLLDHCVLLPDDLLLAADGGVVFIGSLQGGHQDRLVGKAACTAQNQGEAMNTECRQCTLHSSWCLTLITLLTVGFRNQHLNGHREILTDTEVDM